MCFEKEEIEPKRRHYALVTTRRRIKTGAKRQGKFQINVDKR